MQNVFPLPQMYINVNFTVYSIMHKSKHSALIIIAHENRMLKLSMSEDKIAKEKSIKSSPNQQQLTISFSQSTSPFYKQKDAELHVVPSLLAGCVRSVFLVKPAPGHRGGKNSPHWHKDNILCNRALLANLRSTNSLPLAKTLKNKKKQGVCLSLYLKAI